MVKQRQGRRTNKHRSQKNNKRSSMKKHHKIRFRGGASTSVSGSQEPPSVSAAAAVPATNELGTNGTNQPQPNGIPNNYNNVICVYYEANQNGNIKNDTQITISKRDIHVENDKYVIPDGSTREVKTISGESDIVTMLLQKLSEQGATDEDA